MPPAGLAKTALGPERRQLTAQVTCLASRSQPTGVSPGGSWPPVAKRHTAKPAVRGASWTITTRPVFAAEARSVNQFAESKCHSA